MDTENSLQDIETADKTGYGRILTDTDGYGRIRIRGCEYFVCVFDDTMRHTSSPPCRALLFVNKGREAARSVDRSVESAGECGAFECDHSKYHSLTMNVSICRKRLTHGICEMVRDELSS